MILPTMTNSFNSLAKQRFLMHLLVMHDIIITANMFEKHRAFETTTMGLITSLFNHQCTPNIFFCYIDGNETAIAIRPIKAGDQVFVPSYPSRQLNPRQFKFDHYGFWCDCDRCITRCVDTTTHSINGQ